MLTKLRITNESDFEDATVFETTRTDYVFLEAYHVLIDSLKQHVIPKQINSEVCYFLFNGYDPKTNTYFYKMFKCG